MHTLSKATDVLEVVDAGGKIVPGERDGLLQLVDNAGNHVPAWQTALKAVAKIRSGTTAGESDRG
ncbi:MAG: hypothetical protein ACREP4_06515 [Stenotrophomonas sp.]|uniref:hypothetical protein n=1 Tax=Stenotrophomonas sp. TaxID=69392 RepID=UPI003D6CB755